MKKLLGFGINDADYKVCAGKSGKPCPYYVRWSKMLNRCYNPYYLNKKRTYIDCYVCDEWLKFSNFKAWMEKQDWQGRHLDKDILIEGNKIYSPETCAFVLPATNNFILITGNTKDENVGACYDKRSRKWLCEISINGKTKKLGGYNTEEEALAVYRKAKYERTLVVCKNETDSRVKEALIKRYQVNQQPAGQE